MRNENIETHELKLRLQNCLQTILDLKEDLDSMAFGSSFLPELGSLERFLSSLEKITLSEFEVKRVETATEHFLNEIKMLMDNTHYQKSGSAGVLQ